MRGVPHISRCLPVDLTTPLFFLFDELANETPIKSNPKVQTEILRIRDQIAQIGLNESTRELIRNFPSRLLEIEIPIRDIIQQTTRKANFLLELADFHLNKYQDKGKANFRVAERQEFFGAFPEYGNTRSKFENWIEANFHSTYTKLIEDLGFPYIRDRTNRPLLRKVIIEELWQIYNLKNNLSAENRTYQPGTKLPVLEESWYHKSYFQLAFETYKQAIEQTFFLPQINRLLSTEKTLSSEEVHHYLKTSLRLGRIPSKQEMGKEEGECQKITKEIQSILIADIKMAIDIFSKNVKFETGSKYLDVAIKFEHLLAHTTFLREYGIQIYFILCPESLRELLTHHPDNLVEQRLRMWFLKNENTFQKVPSQARSHITADKAKIFSERPEIPFYVKDLLCESKRILSSQIQKNIEIFEQAGIEAKYYVHYLHVSGRGGKNQIAAIIKRLRKVSKNETLIKEAYQRELCQLIKKRLQCLEVKNLLTAYLKETDLPPEALQYHSKESIQRRIEKHSPNEKSSLTRIIWRTKNALKLRPIYQKKEKANNEKEAYAALRLQDIGYALESLPDHVKEQKPSTILAKIELMRELFGKVHFSRLGWDEEHIRAYARERKAPNQKAIFNWLQSTKDVRLNELYYLYKINPDEVPFWFRAISPDKAYEYLRLLSELNENPTAFWTRMYRDKGDPEKFRENLTKRLANRVILTPKQQSYLERRRLLSILKEKCPIESALHLSRCMEEASEREFARLAQIFESNNGETLNEINEVLKTISSRLKVKELLFEALRKHRFSYSDFEYCMQNEQKAVKILNLIRDLERNGKNVTFEDIYGLNEKKKLSKAEEILLGRLKDLEHQDGFNRLVESNMKVAEIIASKYGFTGFLREDLISQGIIGLIEAVKKFDYRKGTKLKTYAKFVIKRYILKYMQNNFHQLKIPRSILEITDQYRKHKKVLEQKFLREATIKELAEDMQVPPEKIEKFKEYDQELREISLSFDQLGDRSSLAVTPSFDTFTAIKEGDLQKILKQLKEKVYVEYEGENLPRDWAIFQTFIERNGSIHLKQLSAQFEISESRISQIILGIGAILRNYPELYELISP